MPAPLETAVYGFDNVDQDIFRGRRLSSITFAEHVTSLTFEGDVVVTAHGAFWYVVEPGQPAREDRFPVADTTLTALVGRWVLTAKKESSTLLVLTLDDGAEIQLRDDSEYYECYLISAPGMDLVV